MRLTEREKLVIKESVFDLDKGADIYLYGSRVDDDKLGGDIDLLIISNKLLSLKDKSKIRWAIYEKLGEQKIDILFSPEKIESNFAKNILENAVKL
jgi:uncharacterized protein